MFKLIKGIPGLKQSGRVWNRTLAAFFETLGFLSISADHSVFVNKDRSIIIAVYVDDMLIFSVKKTDTKGIKTAIRNRFDIKDLGLARNVLGMEIERGPDDSVLLNQRHYIENSLKEEGLESTGRKINTPSTGYSNFEPTKKDEPTIDIRRYQSIEGKLN